MQIESQNNVFDKLRENKKSLLNKCSDIMCVYLAEKIRIAKKFNNPIEKLQAQLDNEIKKMFDATRLYNGIIGKAKGVRLDI